MDNAWLRNAALALLLGNLLYAQPSTANSAVPNSGAAPTTRGKPACGPCCGKDPAAQARATQGISAANPANVYAGKDSYENVVIREGTVVYSLTPGAPPRFAVAYPTLDQAGGSLPRYYELVQVTTDPGKDDAGLPRTLRDKVQAFRVMANVCAARGKALANPQFGRGGGTQYYLSPADVGKLSPEGIRPI